MDAKIPANPTSRSFKNWPPTYPFYGKRGQFVEIFWFEKGVVRAGIVGFGWESKHRLALAAGSQQIIKP